MLVLNTVPLTGALIHSYSTMQFHSHHPSNTHLLSLAHRYTMPLFRLQAVCQSCIVLIACREPSTQHWNVLLECSVWHSYSSGNVWHCLCLSKVLELEAVTSEASLVLALQGTCCLMLQYVYFSTFFFCMKYLKTRNWCSDMLISLAKQAYL
jgi:hypothetical protein